VGVIAACCSFDRLTGLRLTTCAENSLLPVFYRTLRRKWLAVHGGAGQFGFAVALRRSISLPFSFYCWGRRVAGSLAMVRWVGRHTDGFRGPLRSQLSTSDSMRADASHRVPVSPLSADPPCHVLRPRWWSKKLALQRLLRCCFASLIHGLLSSTSQGASLSCLLASTLTEGNAYTTAGARPADYLGNHLQVFTSGRVLSWRIGRFCSLLLVCACHIYTVPLLLD